MRESSVSDCGSSYGLLDIKVWVVVPPDLDVHMQPSTV